VAPRRLGVQLCTLRALLPHDFVGVLGAVRRIGYEEVEFAGYHGHPPRRVRAALDDLGLTAPAAHVGLDALRGGLDRVAEGALVVGHRYLVVPGIGEGERTADGYRRVAADLNAFGARLAGAGLRLAYHNHAFEFEPLPGGGAGYDVLLAETDPALVALEMDPCWAVHGGRDPVALIEAHPGRFPLLHLKDRAPGGQMVGAGAGAIDFARVFAHAERAGLRHAFVEHDEPGDALASVRASYAHLVRLRGS
jgi:sugar phosphate isomerase/epimerase